MATTTATEREGAADDKDDRPAEALMQQQRDDLAANKAADWRSGKGHHDHHRAQALRRVWSEPQFADPVRRKVMNLAELG
jgi:phytoene/squalene synthetase